jgi:hypothetical protein
MFMNEQQTKVNEIYISMINDTNLEIWFYVSISSMISLSP